MFVLRTSGFEPRTFWLGVPTPHYPTLLQSTSYGGASLTQFEEFDVAPGPGAGAIAGGDLHAVADPRLQPGDEHREGGAVHRLVDMVTTLVPQTPDLTGETGGR